MIQNGYSVSPNLVFIVYITIYLFYVRFVNFLFLLWDPFEAST